jgi:hypothetical protein
MPNETVVSVNANLRSHGTNIFSKLIIDNDYPHFRSENTYQSIGDINKLAPLASYVIRDHGAVELIIPHEETLIYIYFWNGEVQSQIAARSEEAWKEAAAWIRSQMVEAPKDEPNIIPITFWSNTANGPHSVGRRIHVPTWDEIADNYTVDVRDQLSNMMTNFKPAHGGQLIIWEGQPGTGKTYSLRALANSWRKWANFHYVVDPEEFFGNAAYMIQVILQDGNEYYPMLEDDVDDEDGQEMKWKVLILEDCGELLSADAKERTGQAVARLLNVVDGMIGQGLKLLVLVTTNEPVKKFHKAITRPGRCAAMVEYKKFEADEAIEWLDKHGVKNADEKVLGATAIAEMYGMMEGFKEVEEEFVGFGFGG